MKGILYTGTLIAMGSFAHPLAVYLTDLGIPISVVAFVFISALVAVAWSAACQLTRGKWWY